MSAYEEIKHKLEGFYRKFYFNQLLKGAILFAFFGLLYFIFTLLVEYFLWLSPVFRTVLFFLFIVVETFLLLKFICVPIFQLTKLTAGINPIESSKIIGNHFPEVQDKLLNILQLKNSDNSELILAGIEQKSKELKPIQFTKAINFKANLLYLKYLAIPVLVGILFWTSGFITELNNSFKRVVDYKTAYTPPAPFAFAVKNQNLKVIEGENFVLQVETTGKVIPVEAKIKFLNQEYYLQKSQNGNFEFEFNNVRNPIDFFIESNGITSQYYTLQVVKTPTIQNSTIRLQYPKHTRKQNEQIDNLSNLSVPEGTKIEWNITTNQTDSLLFTFNAKREFFNKTDNNQFQIEKLITKPISYQISTSNEELKEYEKLNYNIAVFKDEFPKINVMSNIDSLVKGDASFFGQISDDYGIYKLKFVYYNIDNTTNKNEVDLNITNKTIQTFAFTFPDQLQLTEGVNYEMYFEVYDNDGVNGTKKSTSKKFRYRQKTKQEVEEKRLEDQKSYLNNLQQSLLEQKKQKDVLQKLQQDIQNKKDINWNDKKKVDDFIKRQQQYKEMMKRQTEKLQENLNEKKETSPTLKEQKEQLNKRLEELKKLEKQQKLLEELQKVSDKLNKEDLVRKAKQLAEQNKQQEKSLERILELTKRFYVEQKTMQLANKLEDLSKKQDSISNDKENLTKQNELNKEFDQLKKELDELQKDNDKLKEPMSIPETQDDAKSIEQTLKRASQEIKNKNSQKSKQQQKKASNQMKKMSQKLSQSMLDMQSNMIEENVDDLRKILKNLITFSFKQEDLMKQFNNLSVGHPDFGKQLKKQNQIKTYFEHIDDSLYVLSMRVPQISTKIQDDIANTYFNLDQSLYNFSENRFSSGISNQQYVMTSANSLADFLSDLLDNMQSNMSNAKKNGKQSGKSGKGKGEQMQDLIQKQKGLSEKLKEGIKKGKQGNKGEGENEELYQIFKEQSLLRQQLQELLKGKEGTKGEGKQVDKTLEELENDILEKGFNPNTLSKMKTLEYQMLKLEDALRQQGEDDERKSDTNKTNFQNNKIKQLQLKKQFYNQIEILNRQSLPLQQIFKQKVQEYFLNKKIQ